MCKPLQSLYGIEAQENKELTHREPFAAMKQSQRHLLTHCQLIGSMNRPKVMPSVRADLLKHTRTKFCTDAGRGAYVKDQQVEEDEHDVQDQA